MGRRSCRGLGAPDRDARVSPGSAQDRVGGGDSPRSVSVSGRSGRSREREHPQVRQLDTLLDRLDLEALQAAQARQDALATQRLVLDLFIGRS
jgi:hypothetical protein